MDLTNASAIVAGPTDCLDEDAIAKAVKAAAGLGPLRAAVITHIGPNWPGGRGPARMLDRDGVRHPLAKFAHDAGDVPAGPGIGGPVYDAPVPDAHPQPGEPPVSARLGVDTGPGAAPMSLVLHLRLMPTTRPRLTITETDELAEALDAAAARWPEVGSRRELLLRLVEQGRKVIERDREEEIERRRAAIRRTSGAVTGVYEPGYLEQLRGDWPA